MATERDYFHDLAEDLVHGAEESYVADLSEEMLDLLEQGMASEDRWAVVAMRFREAAMGVWARHTGAVTSQCERAFTRALSREDEAIVSSLASEFSAPTGLTNRAANEVMEASRGLAEIISRQNVALADNLADTWWRVTADAVTRTQLGDDPRDVMEDAVSFLSKAGLETIDYRSGQKTSIDAAVRRHAVTQANQCRNDMLVRQCEAYEVDLVFTSAHWGCRPTHSEWQGKPFSLHGTVEVDGVTYRDLAEATGYGTVWGLCGANCRHRLTPYIPGLSKLPDTDFKAFEEKYHMTSEEYYQATQRQRALERQVRATKREIALGQERGLDMTEARYRLGAQQKRLREHCATTGLPRDGERERAYGVREQPRALTQPPARTLTNYLASDEVAAIRAESGLSKTAYGRAVRDELDELGISTRQFSQLGRNEQRSIIEYAAEAESGGRWMRTERARRRDDINLATVCTKPVFIPSRGIDNEQLQKNRRLRANIANIKPLEGFYDVHAHGQRMSVECFTSDIDAKTMAYILRKRNDYDGGPVRLFCCHTGERDASGDCFAQQLADILGVEVMAPPDVTHIRTDGTFFFGDEDDGADFNHFHPRPKGGKR